MLHRCKTSLAQKPERRRIEAGWRPTPTHLQFSSKNIFTAAPEMNPNIGAPMLLENKLRFFGHDTLDLGPEIVWNKDPLTGTTPPQTYGKTLNYRDESLVGNIKTLWELGRHQHLVPLAAAYYHTGDARYKDSVLRQISGWIEQCPFGKGIHWCSSLEAALRVVSWSFAHNIIALRDKVGLKSEDAVLESVYQHAWFIRGHLSRFSSANNHLIGELTGLFFATNAFDLDAEEWSKFAREELERETQRQVYSDGVDKEQATYYHLWVLEYLLAVWLLGASRDEMFSENFRATILKMSHFLRAVTPPKGVPPHIGDSDDGFVARFEEDLPEDPYRDVLSAVDTIFYGEAPATAKAQWYSAIWRDSSPIARPEIAYPAFFPKGGFAVLADERAHVMFDAGDLGYPSIAAHGHADALSFVLAIDGELWIVDPGTYAYHDLPEWRSYFRGTSAHNTFCIEGRDQSIAGGPFLWLERAEVSMDEPNPRKMAASGRVRWAGAVAEHRRRIELDDRLTITDECRAPQAETWHLHFHLHPEVAIEPDGPNLFHLTRPGTTRSAIITVDSLLSWEIVRGSEKPIIGWYSPALGKLIPTSVLRGTVSGRKSFTVETRLSFE